MILDMNVLLGRWPFARLGYEGVDDILRLMDRAGIDRAVATSLDSVFYYDAEVGNHDVGLACRQHPDRLMPFAVINPNLARWREHLARCVGEYGVKGIKLHPDYHKFDLLPGRGHRAEGEELMAEARRLGLPVYVQTSLFDMRHHPGYCFVWEVPVVDVARALERYRDNTFIIGGARWFSSVVQELAKLTEGSRVAPYYVATDGLGGPYDGIGDLAKQIGASRFLFSSRTPLLYSEASKEMIEQSRLSDVERQGVLGLNAARLLGLEA
jgi:predicted TIM-barrel fold metal-dependent hydrolase